MLTSLLATVAALSADIIVDSTDRVLRDHSGRHRIFHGVNIVYKTSPYMPDE
jgi:hypothetical protein